MAAAFHYMDEPPNGSDAHETSASIPDSSSLPHRLPDSQSSIRMNFKGQPGQDGFNRRVKLVQAMMQLPPEKIFATKEKSSMYKEITDLLNRDPAFAGGLKQGTTRDKWLEVISTVDSIIANGSEDKYIKSASSGKGGLNELDELYLRLAREKSEWLRNHDRSREGAAGDDIPQRGRRSVGNAVQNQPDACNVHEAADERMEKSRASYAHSEHSEDGGGSSDENGGGCQGRSSSHPNQQTARESNKRQRVDTDRKADRNRPAIGSANSNFSAVLEWLRSSDEKYHQSLEADREVAKIKAEAELQHEKAKVLKREAEVLAKKTESYERGIELLKLLASCHEKGITVPPHMLV
ncbi:hypothetical protein GUITHDRAFT_141722 [Guillardia theta CCMP2712]|uniref:Uncharacterized protein n=2 Tax=Guillardia theta TaxID=55529 RepID=L1J0V4_GUITC|nr:hypothetical protein GUITHDRAFT_141722 [Guillardia theta CCMP2712]EKX41720.1 hypothetical protein GUITHDRAFT_141722 [Guillardia theta CCMP2712]|eukprot:XP_005828700.1 hypothetical protein GUITHDRAFT_141722 [Guillardia theta CCMP2712]